MSLLNDLAVAAYENLREVRVSQPQQRCGDRARVPRIPSRVSLFHVHPLSSARAIRHPRTHLHPKPPTPKMRLTTCVLFAGAANAFQLPSWLPLGNLDKPQATFSIPSTTDVGDRIAIIGAGAGGSSAAFWIAKAKERFGLDIEVDVFERAHYVGGSELFLLPVMLVRTH